MTFNKKMNGLSKNMAKTSQGQQSKGKQKKSSIPLHDQEEFLQQQLIGNEHLKSKVTKLNHAPNVQQQLMQELYMMCSISNKGHLWKMLTDLTEAQQYAFLTDSFALTESGYQLSGEPAWLEWERHIVRIADVVLETDDTQNDARQSASQHSQAFFEMNDEAFISPYREIWLWLSYKGNHQGKRDILHRLNQLALEQKKWLIHKLIDSDKLSAQLFAEQITIIEYEQRLVDWERIARVLDELALKTEQSIREELEQFNSTEVESRESMENNKISSLKVEDSGLDRLSVLDFLLGFQGDSSNSEKTPLSKEQLLTSWLKSPTQLSMLLFNQPLKKQSDKLPLLHYSILIDRLLMLERTKKSSEKKVIQQRESLLKAYGFVSPLTCATYIFGQIAEHLYEKVSVKRDSAYTPLLIQLGFSRHGGVTKESIIQVLHKLYIG